MGDESGINRKSIMDGYRSSWTIEIEKVHRQRRMNKMYQGLGCSSRIVAGVLTDLHQSAGGDLTGVGNRFISGNSPLGSD